MGLSSEAYGLSWFLEKPIQLPVMELDDCVRPGKNNKHANSTPRACFDSVYYNSHEGVRDESSDRKLFAMGLKNMIFMRELKAGKLEKRMITGDYSRLSDVIAVAISPDKKHLAVLNKGTQMELLIFKTRYDGNVTPVHVMYPDFIQDATAVAFHPDGTHVLVLNRIHDAVYTVPKRADSRSKKESYKVKMVRKLSGAATGMTDPTDMIVLKDSREVAIVDQQTNRVLVFGVEAEGDVAPSRTIGATVGALSNPQYLRLDTETNELQVLDLNNNQKRFPASQ